MASRADVLLGTTISANARRRNTLRRRLRGRTDVVGLSARETWRSTAAGLAESKPLCGAWQRCRCSTSPYRKVDL